MSITMITMSALLVLFAGFAGLVIWSGRRQHVAFAYEYNPALRTAPACEIGQQLLMASPSDTTGGAGSGGNGSSGPGAQTREPKRKKSSGPSRRRFLRNSMGIGWLGVLGSFGGASLAFLWPQLGTGFGAVMSAGNVDEILDEIRDEQQPFVFPEGRSYLVEYDPDDDPTGEYAELTDGSPLMAIYWVCVHLGCQVPFCDTSQWFECACHGSAYNRWGEFRDGPAPRGLDRFPVYVEEGELMVDTGQLTEISRQQVVLEQPREGPSCI